MKFPNEILPAYAIWENCGEQKDEYVDFFPCIEFEDNAEYILRIVCDTDRAVYLDGHLISFGQYADYPSTPVYEDIRFMAKADSKLKITAWHSGIDSQTHVATNAYVAFCILKDNNVVYASSENTLCRMTPEYVQHLCKIITSQMGAGFALSGRASVSEPHTSVVKDINFNSLRKRPIKALNLGAPIAGNTVREGYCKLGNDSDLAFLMSTSECDISKGEANGCYILLDFGRELVGFPEISFVAVDECDVAIGWGEHIIDGSCRSAIHSRRFTTSIEAHTGYNHYFPVLRRFGLRYMQLYFNSTEISDISVKFHPTLLPVDIRKFDYQGENAQLKNKIRETAIHTLLCCMHEHYEDCPWREQALYTLDSRNQMLVGYEVFEDKNAEFVRANLDLISRGVRKDGILALCYPAGLDYPIPFYTLAYLMQMDEYIQNTGDITLAQEKFDILVNLLDVFYKRSGENHLAKRFPDSEGYWNFYEWSKHLSGSPKFKDIKPDEQPYEANLSAALSLASGAMANICKAIGKDDQVTFYADKAKKIAQSIANTFYNPETKFFFDFTNRPEIEPSVLTQAMCVLCGAAEGLDHDNILKAIADNGGLFENFEVVPATLSMACFRYDALLKINKENYKNTILNEIDRDCRYMLDQGATTFWETLKGAADFSGAGSLCHGWSAMAAYYYSKLL